MCRRGPVRRRRRPRRTRGGDDLADGDRGRPHRARHPAGDVLPDRVQRPPRRRRGGRFRHRRTGGDQERGRHRRGGGDGGGVVLPDQVRSRPGDRRRGRHAAGDHRRHSSDAGDRARTSGVRLPGGPAFGVCRRRPRSRCAAIVAGRARGRVGRMFRPGVRGRPRDLGADAPVRPRPHRAVRRRLLSQGVPGRPTRSSSERCRWARSTRRPTTPR